MALTVLTSQISESLDYLVARRLKDFDYLKRSHEGSIHWLNSVRLSKSIILNGLPADKLHKRTRRWFVLGLSVSLLLELTSEYSIARSAAQLIEEYEHWITHEKERKSISPVYSLKKPFSISQPQHGVRDNHEPIKPALNKVKGAVVYEILQTPFTGIDESLDYNEIVYSLCDVFCLLYSKFSDSAYHSPVLKESFIKFDKAIRKLVVGKICNDLTIIATQVLQKDTFSLLNRMFVEEAKSNKIMKKFYELSEPGKKINVEDVEEERSE